MFLHVALASHAGTCELYVHTKIQQVEALAQTLLAFERGLSWALLAVRRAHGCCHWRRIAVLVQAAVSYDMRHPSQAASLLFHKRLDFLFLFWRASRLATDKRQALHAGRLGSEQVVCCCCPGRVHCLSTADGLSGRFQKLALLVCLLPLR